MAELWPRASNSASKKRTTTIGCRIQRLLLRRKAKNSLAAALRLATVEERLINDTDGLGRRRPGENVTSPSGSGQSRLSRPHRDSRIPYLRNTRPSPLLPLDSPPNLPHYAHCLL